MEDTLTKLGPPPIKVEVEVEVDGVWGVDKAEDDGPPPCPS